jgi:hypothetical protein
MSNVYDTPGSTTTSTAGAVGLPTATSPWDTVLPTGNDFFEKWKKFMSLRDPQFAKGVSLYGDKFLKLSWWSANNAAEPEKILQYFIEGEMYGLAGPTSYGGGGGGPSKAQQYAAAEAAIRNQAYTLGYTTLADPEIKILAKTVVDQNWSSEQLTDRLVNDATKNYDALTGGTIRGAVDMIKNGAASQLIAVSDATARQWAKRIASGELNEDGLRNMLQTQATARYGWAADVIQSGVTMSDFLAPSRDRLSQELEVTPEELSLLDPKIMDMTTVVDAKSGQRRVANDVELIRNARKDERWKSTSNARSTLSSAAMMLRRYVEGN